MTCIASQVRIEGWLSKRGQINTERYHTPRVHARECTPA
jgi:hypothetical protein